MYFITDNIDKTDWSLFIIQHPGGNIFQAPEIFEVYKRTKIYYPFVIGVLDAKYELVGILLSIIQKEHQGIIGKFSARSIIVGGPIIKDDNIEVLELLLKEYNKKIKSKAIYTQVRNLFENKWSKTVFENNGFSYEPHLNILIDLNKSKSDLWKEVHSKRRNEIRRATKEGTIFKINNSKEALIESYKILEEVYQRAKLPLPHFSHFEALLNYSDNKSGLIIGTAMNNGKIIGCMLALAYKKTIYDYYAGAYKTEYKKYPNDLIPWEIFIWGKENGYEIFDFGGAGKPGVPYGVRDYKKKFGGDIVNYGRYYKIHKPFLFKIAKLGFKVWQKIKK